MVATIAAKDAVRSYVRAGTNASTLSLEASKLRSTFEGIYRTFG